jgi:hypothetical protein
VVIGIQAIRSLLKKLNESLHGIVEGTKARTQMNADERQQGSYGEWRRQQAKFRKRVVAVRRAVEPMKDQECFGTINHDAIRQEMDRRQTHRDRVMEWLDAVIKTKVSEEGQQMNKQAHAVKMIEAVRASKETAMKRFSVQITIPKPPNREKYCNRTLR